MRHRRGRSSTISGPVGLVGGIVAVSVQLPARTTFAPAPYWVTVFIQSEPPIEP